MKKIFLLLFAIVVLTSCEGPTDRHSEHIVLRQLVKSETREQYASASFFLIAGSAHSGEYTSTTVKAMGAVNDEYRYIEMEFDKVRIKIDNGVKIPYVILNYNDVSNTSTDHLLRYPYSIDSYTIVCPEAYLPERLLPIQL